MPIYAYKHPETGEVKEILQGVNDEHSYEENGVKWLRVWDYTFSASSTNIDPFDERAFTRITGEKKGTVGDIMDLSKEMSEKRKKIAGHDPVKEKWEEDYAKKRNGLKPPPLE